MQSFPSKKKKNILKLFDKKKYLERVFGKPPKHSLRKRSSLINMVDKLFAKQKSKGSQPEERRAVRFTPLG